MNDSAFFVCDLRRNSARMVDRVFVAGSFGRFLLLRGLAAARRRLIGIFRARLSRLIRQWDRFEVHFWRAWLPSGRWHWRVRLGLISLGDFHVSAPFQVENEPAAMGYVPHGEAF